MDFFVRYIADSFFIAEERSLSLVAERVRATAVCLAVLGQVDCGTRLLTILHEHGIPPFDYEEFGLECCTDRATFEKSLGIGRAEEAYSVRVSSPRADPYTRAVFCFAWEHTNTWPSWISRPRTRSGTETALAALEVHAREVVCNRFGHPWKEDKDTFYAALGLGMNKSSRANPHGPIPVRIMQIWSLWERMLCPWQFNQLMRSTGRVLALDLAVRLGIEQNRGGYDEEDGEDAISYLGGWVARTASCEDQVGMVGSMRALWQSGWFDAGKNVFVEELKIDIEAVRDAATRGYEILVKRLNHGPARPYAEMTYGALVKAIDKGTRANGPYESYAVETRVLKPSGKRTETRPFNRKKANRPKSLLSPPATDYEISNLEDQLGIGSTLPDTYKQFLKTSNGLGAIWWNHTQLLRLLGPISSVRMDIEMLSSPELKLVNDDELYGEWIINWPPLKRAIAINVYGHEGDLWLVEPRLVEVAKRIFFQAYDSRPPPEQDRLRRLAEETYGSLDALRDLEWGTLMWTSWFAKVVPHADVRGFLEVLAEGCQTPARNWDIVFDPGLMQLDAYWYRYADEVEKGDTMEVGKGELIVGKNRSFTMGKERDGINSVNKVMVDY